MPKYSFLILSFHFPYYYIYWLFLGVVMASLTRFERARIIGARALQLALGAPPLVKPNKEATPYTIAKQEFESKVLPMSVLRIYPDGAVERVEVN